MNAQVMLTSPGYIGADVCHLNLHKTFSIPHGGGGPGLGPICVKKHLIPYLPCDPKELQIDPNSSGCVSASHYSSALIALIPYMYIRMLGSEGLRESTKVAILNANYIKYHLKDDFKVKYTNKG